MFGWTAKLLRVDLSSQQIKEETISPKILTQFMGGKGLGSYFLYHEVPSHTNALSPENRFYLVTGPLQGTGIPITGRIAAISKSPVTNHYIDSQMGGYLGPELKRAGYDLLVIQGQAEKPAWLQISPDETEIKNAKDLWGKTTHETEHILRKSAPKTGILSIGPAGEKGALLACLVHNYFRNFGRGGLGAVFGAKQLKAIAVRGGSNSIPTSDDKQKLEMVKELARRAKKAKEKGHSLHYHGTPWLVPYANTTGQFPTRNFQTTFFEDYEKISPEHMEANVDKKLQRTPCEGCLISCAWTTNKSFTWIPKDKSGYVAMPEYETLGMMGGNLGISDPETIIRLNFLCNWYGLDTISTGNVIGLFMEASERGLLPKDWEAQGIQFGETNKTVTLVEEIGRCKGLGRYLAKGTKQFAQHLGTKAQQIAVETKGLEYPAWDPRAKLGLGLSYVTAACGASHLRGWPRTAKPPEKSAIDVLDSLVKQQNLKILKDSLIICHFTHSISPALTITDCVNLYNLATGDHATEDTLNEVAERVWLLARMFNERESDQAPRTFDSLPPRFMNEPIPSGPRKGFTAFITQEDFEESLTQLYQRRGCDAEGRPTKEAKQRLGLETIKGPS